MLEELKPYHAQLVAVSKTKSATNILEVYHEGQRDFGENRVQEIVEKHQSLPADIRWHFIGHLQTNKVRDIAPFIHLIHSIDSAKVLKEINKQAQKNDRIIDCLLQFKVAEEAAKYGLSLEAAQEILQSESYQNMENIRLVGIMGMATFTYDKEQVRKEFRQLKSIFDTLKQDYFSTDDHFKEISMGMSGDYKIALEEGSTMVRIGSLIFGART